MGARRAARAVTRAFGENDLLTHADAISFQTFFFLIPAVLLGAGLLGFFGLEPVWRVDLVPVIQPVLSPPAFALVDELVVKVLTEQQAFWTTLGAAFAIWKGSSAVRAVMGALNVIYRAEDERSFLRRMAVSSALALAWSVLIATALGLVQFDPFAPDPPVVPSIALSAVSFVVRWALAGCLILAAVALLVRFAPARDRPAAWITVGSVLTVVVWLVMSIGFRWYVTSLADFGSVFGNLATLIIGLQYLYCTVVVFLGGLQVDALLRQRFELG
jgi:membrane protein